jgi:serine/threonine protein kinase
MLSTLYKWILNSDGFLQKFCREALTWHNLRHPRTLPLIGIDRDSFSPSLCMVSPWMEHGTVLRYLDKHGRANVDRLVGLNSHVQILPPYMDFSYPKLRKASNIFTPETLSTVTCAV